jgi:hypothetical protein
MFCSACGFENIQGVNFCKNCGANLNPSAAKTQSPWLIGIFLAVIALITVIGLIGPMVVLSDLSHKGTDEEPLIAMTIFFLAATTIIDWLLIRLLNRLLGFTKVKEPGRGRAVVAQPKYVTSEQPYQQLQEPQISMPSVTEHTTRNFEPIIPADRHSRPLESRNREMS